MALKDWGPLTAAKKQSEISAAFEGVKKTLTLDDLEDLDKVKKAVYDKLKETYKLNQAKFSTWQKFWANTNYEKHVIYLEGLVDTELEARGAAVSSYTYTSKSKTGAGGSGGDNGTGTEPDSGMTTLLVVGIIAVVVVLLIKKFRKK